MTFSRTEVTSRDKIAYLVVSALTYFIRT